MIDKDALLAHIRGKAEHPNLLIHAVLAGLVTAIERGDFDMDSPELVHRPDAPTTPESSGTLFDAPQALHRAFGVDAFGSEGLRSEGGTANDMVQGR